MNRIIVAGIGTEVGKTVVAAILTEAMNGYYWKPVQCGLPKDQSWVGQRLSWENRCYPESVCLSTPCSPHLAARKEGTRVEARKLVPPICFSDLIIEGTGGILVPLNETENWIDAAMNWNGSWVLVHHHYLGSLNHFFLTIESMKKRKIPLLGVIFNGEGDLETEEMLLKKANTVCLGRLPWQEHLTKAVIQEFARKWKTSLQTALGC